jgi:two-component system cell cycle response regulator DivK
MALDIPTDASQELGMCHKILLVEDDEMNRDMLSRRLQLENYDVVQAVNGLDGLALAHTEAPDLILMDISLPELDGWEATRRLKGDKATCRIPVIVLTAHAMTGDAERFFEAGCDAYESKPIDWQRLMIAMTALLNSRTV